MHPVVILKVSKEGQAKIKNVERYEGRMDVEGLVERAVAGIMVTEITPIEEAQDEVDTLIEDLL